MFTLQICQLTREVQSHAINYRHWFNLYRTQTERLYIQTLHNLTRSFARFLHLKVSSHWPIRKWSWYSSSNSIISFNALKSSQSLCRILLMAQALKFRCILVFHSINHKMRLEGKRNLFVINESWSNILHLIADANCAWLTQTPQEHLKWIRIRIKCESFELQNFYHFSFDNPHILSKL